MSVVAHPDDDLYFLNPGISSAISAEVPIVGVVMTSAEGDGRNVDTGDPDRESAPVDYAGYSEARRVGLRRAYARMAGLPVDHPWKQKLVKLRTGFTVEQDTLKGRPDVVLYFFNLAHRDVDGKKRYTLPFLLNRELDATPTMPSITLPTPVQTISRETIVASLAELIRQYQPTVLRTLDPDPEHDWGATKFVVSDHAEHTATARFTIEAVRQLDPNKSRLPIMEYYRGYANRYWAINLCPALFDEKAKYLATYSGADGEPNPGLPYGHGDYQMGTNPYRSTHMFSSALRYVATSRWMARLPSGELAAFAVLGDRLAMWSERTPASGVWQGPALIGPSGLMPTLAVASRGDGPVHVVALRRTDPGERIDVEAGYVTVSDAGRVSEWVSLDGPDSTDTDRRKQREIGVPAATVDGRGDLWVFVRDFTGGLSCRRQDVGEWQPWEALGRGPLQDVPFALTDGEGLVQVYAVAKRTVAHWRQKKTSGPLEPNHTLKTGMVASGGLVVARTAGDRACLFFRQGADAREPENHAAVSIIRAHREHPNGDWPGGTADLGGAGGIGPVAVIDRLDSGAGDLVMAHRNEQWTVSVSVPPTSGPADRWEPMPGMITGAPALARDSAGRGVLVALGMDGRLHVARQESASPKGKFGDWTVV
ncbi:PIG-L family deacetylase [Actinoplanes missouriensis]|uniref:PIG-L family deacetylase n=1 Tax=Actinoplanes missouriensis TaxID=1866 RepID=UPI003401D1E6